MTDPATPVQRPSPEAMIRTTGHRTTATALRPNDAPDRCRWLGWAAAALVFAGCTSRQDLLRSQLESYDPANRIRAIVEVAAAQDASFVPALVDRLDDEDAAVRMVAILALDELTGTRQDYNYAAPRAERQAAIQRWRGYVRDRVNSRSAAVAADDPGAARVIGDAW